MDEDLGTRASKARWTPAPKVVSPLPGAGGVLAKGTFDPETENPPELQRMGWQAILDSFGRRVEAKG